MSLQEDCRMNRWPARDTATTFYECVCMCVLLISLQEHLLRSVWHRSELTLSPAAVEKSMFSVFMLDYRHLTDWVANYACGKDHTCQSDRTPARTCQSTTCMLPFWLCVQPSSNPPWSLTVFLISLTSVLYSCKCMFFPLAVTVKPCTNTRSPLILRRSQRELWFKIWKLPWA